jgi:allantoate deiminase
MKKANTLVARWMRKAGMTVHTDNIGNLVGRLKGSRKATKTLLIGSHLDTVRDAGRYDGPLGVVAPIAVLAEIKKSGLSLPFHVELAGFSDEEGVRYQSTYLGSRVMAGTFDSAELKRKDAKGITMRQAIETFGGRPALLKTDAIEPKDYLGYFEMHIEQGPVLESENLPLGVVTQINGQCRARLAFQGKAGHAGTTPMKLRRDALAGAVEWMSFAESLARKQENTVVTVGEVEVSPGASNVIPGRVQLSLDIRHSVSSQLQATRDVLHHHAETIAARRNLAVTWDNVLETPAVHCDDALTSLLEEAVCQHLPRAFPLSSGAGHDAVVMSRIMPMTMLFMRCKDGLSHHPDESVHPEDIAAGLKVFQSFLELLAKKQA